MNNDNNIEQIKEDLADIKKDLFRIEKLYQKTMSYATLDPEVSLLQARKAAEAICKHIFIKEISPNIGNLMLNQLIDKLVTNKVLPKKIVVPLRTIQSYGNFGVHDQGDEISENEITIEYIQPCLSSLATVVNWYFNEYYEEEKVFKFEEYSPGDVASDKNNVRIDHNSLNVHKNKLKLVNETQLERLSFGLSISAEDTDVQDDTHHYEFIKRIDIPDSETGKYTSYRWLKIRNVTNIPSNYIYHMESGENKISFDSLDFRAYEYNYKGARLKINNLVDRQPSFVQKIKIHFLKPLAPNQELIIFYRLTWPSEVLSYSGDEYSQSISLIRYKKGVSHLIFGVLDKLDIFGVYSHKASIEFEELQLEELPVFFEAEEDEDILPLHNKELKGFYFEYNQPDGTAYRLFYQLLTKIINDEEEF